MAGSFVACENSAFADVSRPGAMMTPTKRPSLLITSRCVGYAVGADLVGVVVVCFEEAAGRSRVAYDGLHADEPLERLAPGRRERRHDGCDGSPVHLGCVDAFHEQERTHFHAQLVRGVNLARGNAPHMFELRLLEYPYDGLGVADIDYEQHVRLPFGEVESWLFFRSFSASLVLYQARWSIKQGGVRRVRNAAPTY